MNNLIWIVGAGGIAIEYAKILKSLGRDFIVIGRGETSAVKFKEATGREPILGGLENYLKTNPELPEKAINCVRASDLGKTNICLSNYGVKYIMSEKPGFLPEEVEAVRNAVTKNGTTIYIAYNRRFYASVFAAEKIIKEDGGLLSFNFEFTEWAHVIEASASIPEIEKNNLFMTNSTHVVDLAFFLGGEPKEMTCYQNGSVGWHTPSNFAGSGITDKGVLFSYNANWNAPGRWAVELLTAKHRIYLKPMEQFQLQDKGSVKVYPVEIDDHLDKEFKPGFYLQTKAFLNNDIERLCTIEQQLQHISSVYLKISGH